MKSSIGLFAVLAAALLCYSPEAFAEKGGKGHGKSKHDKHWKHDDDHDRGHRGRGRGHDDDDVVIIIDRGDRVVIKDYLGTHYAAHCPPGLAKKRNGCLPPGQAKKLYRVGYPLEDYVVYHSLPRDLLGRLGPVPVGYQYVMVDRDVLLISEATKKVIDAITLYSAVGY